MNNKDQITKAITSLQAYQLVGALLKSAIEELAQDIRSLPDNDVKNLRAQQLVDETDLILRFVHGKTDKLIKQVDNLL